MILRSGYTDHPLSSIRSVIAQRLTASKQTSPHGHATAASDMAAVIRQGHLRNSIPVTIRLGNRCVRVSVFGSKCCVFLAVCGQIGKIFWGLLVLGQVKSIQNFC